MPSRLRIAEHTQLHYVPSPARDRLVCHRPEGRFFSGALKFSSLRLPDDANAYGYMGTGAVARALSVRFS